MAKLNLKTRQKYLKELGFYKGQVDGKEGPLTKQAYKNLQNAYFTRKKDLDGKYGPDTDTLLRCAYNCRNLEHFDLEEFRCGCKGKYCTGYPVVIKRALVLNLDDTRTYHKRPINITSGLRCKKHNKKVGGSTGSYHTKGGGADFYMSGKSSSFSGRKELVKYWSETFENARYSYCNGYGIKNGKVSYPTSKTMGSAVHVDIK